MNLRHLQTFVQVVRDGSLYKAANSLGYAQATVTKQIQQLEGDLGAELFTRNGKRVAVSAAGLTLYDKAVDLLERASQLEATLRNFGAGVGGVLRIGAIEPIASTKIAPLLASFCASRKDLTVLFEVGGSESLAESIERGRLDAAIGTLPERRPKLCFEALFDEELYVIVPAGHPLARKASVTIDDALSYQTILTGPECAYRQAFEAAPRARERGSGPARQISSISALLAAVEGGMGIGILPKAPATGAAVVTKRLRGDRISLSLGIVSARGASQPPAMSRFLDVLRTKLRR